MFAEVNNADLEVLFVLLAVVAFGAAIWAGFRNLIPAAVVCAFIGIIIILFAV